MTTATVDKVKAGPREFVVQTSGQGEPLVWLHGWEGPEVQRDWADRLSANHRLVAPQMPGTAGTEADADFHEMHNVVTAYLDLFDALGLESFDLAGHSLGAMFAAEIAAMATKRVRRMVLVAPLGLWFDEAPLPDFVPSGGPALARMIWADPASDVVAANGLPVIERTANVGTATSYLWPIADRGLSARIHRLTMPVLLLRGEKDGVVSDAYVDRYLKHLPRGQAATVAGAAHYPQLEQPEAFVQQLETFLKG
ncbi:MAG: alpha/beta hydrolase [Dehalococcoidia bacterium]